jgi:hypothetical protein
VRASIAELRPLVFCATCGVSSDADRPAPAGCAALRLLADVDTRVTFLSPHSHARGAQQAFPGQGQMKAEQRRQA